MSKLRREIQPPVRHSDGDVDTFEYCGDVDPLEQPATKITAKISKRRSESSHNGDDDPDYVAGVNTESKKTKRNRRRSLSYTSEPGVSVQSAIFSLDPAAVLGRAFSLAGKMNSFLKHAGIGYNYDSVENKYSVSICVQSPGKKDCVFTKSIPFLVRNEYFVLIQIQDWINKIIGAEVVFDERKKYFLNEVDSVVTKDMAKHYFDLLSQGLDHSIKLVNDINNFLINSVSDSSFVSLRPKSVKIVDGMFYYDLNIVGVGGKKWISQCCVNVKGADANRCLISSQIQHAIEQVYGCVVVAHERDKYLDLVERGAFVVAKNSIVPDLLLPSQVSVTQNPTMLYTTLGSESVYPPCFTNDVQGGQRDDSYVQDDVLLSTPTTSVHNWLNPHWLNPPLPLPIGSGVPRPYRWHDVSMSSTVSGSATSTAVTQARAMQAQVTQTQDYGNAFSK